MWVDTEALHYVPILVLMSVGLIIGLVLIGVNLIFGVKPKELPKERFDVYECGVPSVGDARQQFSVRYYVIGIVFLLFDVEVVFLYPWAVVYRKYLTENSFILMQMIAFLLILFASYIYLLGRRGLDWD